QGNEILDVAEDLGGPADGEPRVVDRRYLPELPPAQAVGAAQVETLEDRHLAAAPPENVTALQPSRDDVAEPDRLEVRRRGDRLDEAGVTSEAGELQGQRALAAPRRRLEVVAAVPGDRRADERGHPRALRGGE